MGKFLRAALPIGLSFLAPGIGTAFGISNAAAGAGLGALGGALGGGGIKGAALGALGGYAGQGGFGTLARNAVGGVGPQTAGSGLLGSLSSGSNPLASGLRAIGGAMNTVGSGVSNAIGNTAGGGASSVASGGFGNLLRSGLDYMGESSAAKKMARMQNMGLQRGIDALSPYQQTGASANMRLRALLGLDDNADQESVLAALRNTPGYQFQMDQGQKAIDTANAARGSFYSGRALKEAQQFGQGLADQTYNDAIRNLMQQSGQGMNAAGGLAGMYGTQGDINATAALMRRNALSRLLAGFGG